MHALGPMITRMIRERMKVPGALLPAIRFRIGS